jgi:predicted lysophospholipase L1 biosynthesis ABC-type transport system permease subunit
MSVLYPVTIAVSVLVAAGLAVLIMFQNAKSAAVMRVLGSKKAQTRTALCAEQIVLSITGLTVGLIILAIIVRDINAATNHSALFCVVLYIAGTLAGSLFGAILVTNKTPLELLQVRE